MAEEDSPKLVVDDSPMEGGDRPRADFESETPELLRTMNGLLVRTEHDPDRSNFHVIPHFNRRIRRFTRSEAPSAAQLWLDELENLAVLYVWPDTYKLVTAQMNMTQGARCWFEDNCLGIATWTAFKECFRATCLAATATPPQNAGPICRAECNAVMSRLPITTLKNRDYVACVEWDFRTPKNKY